MPRFIKKTSKKAGLAPGSLVHIGEKKSESVKISLMNYDAAHLEEKQLPTIDASFPYRDTPPATWVNVDGLHELNVVEKMGAHFGIHPLVLEDIVHTGQRTKVEEFDNYIYIVLKMLVYDEKVDHITAEQLSLILGAHFLFSFQGLCPDGCRRRSLLRRSGKTGRKNRNP
jgi:magnesium transporter